MLFDRSLFDNREEETDESKTTLFKDSRRNSKEKRTRAFDKMISRARTSLATFCDRRGIKVRERLIGESSVITLPAEGLRSARRPFACEVLGWTGK